MHEKSAPVIEAKHKLFGEMSLNIFLSGLREPLGSTIRAMQPKTLIEAFYFCVQEQNCYYMKSHTPTPITRTQPVSQSQNYRPISNLQTGSKPQTPHYRPPFQSNNVNSFSKPYNNPNQYNQPKFQPQTNNSRPPQNFAQAAQQKPQPFQFRQPQPFQFRQPQPFQFRQPQPGPSNKSYPQPMELGSEQSRQPRFNRELHNIDQPTSQYESQDLSNEYYPDETSYYHPYEPNLDQYYPESNDPIENNEPEIDENFQKTSSNNSDT